MRNAGAHNAGADYRRDMVRVLAGRASEAAPTMVTGMALLTAACCFLGLFPTLFLRLFDPVTEQLTGYQLSSQLNIANGLVLGNTQALGGTGGLKAPNTY